MLRTVDTLFASAAMDQVLWIVGLILIVIMVLIIIRFAISLFAKIIAIGCGLIVLIGLVLAALYYFGFIG